MNEHVMSGIRRMLGANIPLLSQAAPAVTSAARAESNDNPQPLGEDVYLGIAWKTFADRVPNSLGEGAMKIDDKGLYTAAVNEPEYYLHHANKRLFAKRSVAVANRVNGIRHAIIFGQGPGDVFAEQEALLLEQLGKLEEVTTIEFSRTFNDEASGVIADISKKVGRPIKHNKITQSFEKAAQMYPELLLSSEKKLVINSGSTIMNLANDVPDEFPRRALQEKLRLMTDMAGEEGFVLVTYDAYREDKVPAKLAAYQTPAAKELFLNAIDMMAEKRPELRELNRANFDYVVQWNEKSYNAEQMLRVIDPINIQLRYKGEHDTFGNFRGMQEAGEDYQIINSFMPPVEEVMETAEEIGAITVMALADETDDNNGTGFTMQLMKMKPRAFTPMS